MNINELIEHGKLSGIKPDTTTMQSWEEATRKPERLRSKINELKQQVEAIRSTDKAELAKKIAEGGALKKTLNQMSKQDDDAKNLTDIIASLETSEVPKAEQDLKSAEKALSNSIRIKLRVARKEMEQQLETAIMERVKLLNESRTGILDTTPPAKQSKSRICVCEVCKQEIAVIGENIEQPVNGTMFLPIGRQDLPPFIPQAEIQFFKCPYCSKRPWGDFGKILTNAGYFVVPKLKDDDREVAEIATV